MGDQAYTLPGENGGKFYRHILLNDKAQTLFCFVAKVGCTNLKVLFFAVQGECVWVCVCECVCVCVCVCVYGVYNQLFLPQGWGESSPQRETGGKAATSQAC